jgi:hydroxypyruvate isomerase
VKIGPIPKGWNRIEHHDLLVQAYEPLLKTSAEAGFKQPHLLQRQSRRHERRAGPRKLRQRPPAPAGRSAEKLGVTLVMELLNSKVNHKDYMCDHTAWGVELCKKLGSERFKLLYDIYHMQIMEGDVIRTIRTTPPTFATTTPAASRPRRDRRDAGAELPRHHARHQETGYTGFVGQEFIPKREDKLASLKQA